MDNHKVIAHSNLPTKLPLFSNIIVWLLLDRFHAPEWAHAVMWTFFAIIWIGSAIAIHKEKHFKIDHLLK